MLVYLLYNKATPAERQMNELNERLKREQLDTELIDADSPRGIQLADNYAVMGRPAVLLVRNDGGVVGTWEGVEGLPVPSEVAYLARQ